MPLCCVLLRAPLSYYKYKNSQVDYPKSPMVYMDNDLARPLGICYIIMAAPNFYRSWHLVEFIAPSRISGFICISNDSEKWSKLSIALLDTITKFSPGELLKQCIR